MSRPTLHSRRQHASRLSLESLERREVLSATLLADINQVDFGVQPTEITAVGDTVFYTSRTGGLWFSDGTEKGTQLLRDNLHPQQLNGLQDQLIFVGQDDAHGQELWSSDGTPGGTTLLLDLVPGAASSSPAELFVHAGDLYFTTDTIAPHRVTLWKSDGTSAGTEQLGTVPRTSNFASAGDDLYFSGSGELWTTDGSSAGTRLVTTRPPHVSTIVPVGDQIFLATFNAQLWQTDGTDGGTELVTDLRAVNDYFEIREIVEFQGSLWFGVAEGDDSADQLWTSDGTAEGTELVTEFTGRGGVGGFQELGDSLYFAAFDEAHGQELWKTDGTAVGTTLAFDIWPGPPRESSFGFGNGSPRELTAVGATLFFTAQDSVEVALRGVSLWRTDGTAKGTFALGSQAVNGLTSSGGQLFFSGEGGQMGPELWKSDGLAAGTQVVLDTQSGHTNRALPLSTAVVGDSLYLSADDGIVGRELWTVDGTEAEPRLVSDSIPGPPGAGIQRITEHEGDAYFFSQRHLYRSDGTAPGTMALTEKLGSSTNLPFEPMRSVGDTLYFARMAGHSWQLAATDGTVDGTRTVRRFSDVPAAAVVFRPSQLAEFKGELYFSGWDSVNRRGLWKSDGSEQGTVLIQAFPKAPVTASTLNSLTAVADNLFFGAPEGLWTSDGTTDGTQLLFAGDVQLVGAINDELLFAADAGLWKSDGTKLGTSLVTDALSMDQVSLVAPPSFSDRIYFAADDGVHGVEPWVSDGTADGTYLVRDVQAGPGSSSPDQWTVVDDSVFFTADDGVNGLELWKTDLQSDRTVLVADIHADPEEGPTQLVGFNKQLVFSADDGVLGRELWKAATVDGDFDQDGEFSPTDVDLLVAQIVAANNTNDSAVFDLNLDGTVDPGDLATWLSQAGDNEIGVPYQPGDANLDGFVDGLDFLAWNRHKFGPGGAWTAGDFNADGQVDELDFEVWRQHSFASGDAAPVVQPPSQTGGQVKSVTEDTTNQPLAVTPRTERLTHVWSPAIDTVYANRSLTASRAVPQIERDAIPMTVKLPELRRVLD